MNTLAPWPPPGVPGELSALPVPPAPGPRPGVYLIGAERAAVLPLEQAAAMLGVAKTIEDQGRSIRQADRLAALLTFAGRLREAMATGSSAVRFDVDASEEQIAVFLLAQTRSRAELRSRIRHTCRTCGLDSLSNPDFDRLKRRNQAISAAARGVGLAVFSAGIAPFFMVSSLLGFVKLDPDYVCARCKGMDADEQVVVFCPNCRDQCDQAVIKACRRCGHDLVRPVDLDELWQPLDAIAAPAPQGELSAGFDVGVDLATLHFLPDGRRIVLTDRAGAVQCWQVGDGPGDGPGDAVGDVTASRRIWSNAPTGGMRAPKIAVTRDGRGLAVTAPGDTTIRLLRADDGVVAAAVTSRGAVSDMVFRPDGWALALAAGNADLVDLSGRLLVGLSLGALTVPSYIAMSPDGAYLVADGWTSLIVFQVADGRRLVKIPLGTTAHGLVWTSLPHAVAVNIVSAVRVYGVPTGTLIHEFAQDAVVSAVAAWDRGPRLAVASGTAVRVYDLGTGGEIVRIGIERAVRAVAFAPDGRLAIGDDRGAVLLWSRPELPAGVRPGT